MIYGYARVSTKGQERGGNGLDVQRQALTERGAVKIYSDAFTGTQEHRPELDKLIDALRPGDVVLVAKLDRVARSVRGGIAIIDAITAKGAALDILNMGRFDATPTGKLMRTMFLAFAEFERDMIVERTTAGKEIARKRPGYREGRPAVNAADVARANRLVSFGWTVSDACSEAGISRQTFYKERRKKCEQQADRERTTFSSRQ